MNTIEDGKVYIDCSCGGGASVAVEPDQKTAVVQCACGAMLFWEGGDIEIAPNTPKTLSFGVGDSIKLTDGMV